MIRLRVPVVVLLVLSLLTGVAWLGSPPARAEAPTVSMKDLGFSPSNVQVTVGEAVTWSNDETTLPHDVVSGTLGDPSLGEQFRSPLLNPGQTFTATFDQPGEYPYVCSLHPFMAGVITVVGQGGSAALLAPGRTSPQVGPPSLPSNAQVVASGLINPRGFTWAPDGALIVAEAGAPPEGFAPPPGGQPVPDFRPGTNLSGRVSRIDPTTGERTSLVENLPSSTQLHGDTLGPANVAFLGSDLYVLISAGPVHGWPYYPSGVYKVSADGNVRLVANLDAFNARNPVAFISPDDEISNPYDMIAANGALWITDGNRNQVYRVTPDGAISRVADLSDGHPITTGIALAPDGALLVSELTAVPFPEGGGRIRRISAEGQTEVIASGTTAATGLALAPDGSVYVVEHSVSLGHPPFLAPFSGRVVRLDGDGSLAPVAGGLMFPTIARFGADGMLYVAQFSVGGDAGAGQILRIDTAH